ncbi:hypothetical protein Terro_0678 [Terriglobus roseus DSM 18391]|uniref:Uncharacterized protein n=2 Tax=Terriglobus roseus TaxID=392734 RepID=I3ZCP7_TERRK|nr:hypothetical protein Terro_0678 [Terriglobus roseus DSM 18391]
MVGALLGLSSMANAASKVHVVALGPVRRVPYVAADVSRDAKEDEAGMLRIRPLTVDGVVREWTTGDQHNITDRSFVTRRVIHVNDALPSDKAGRWVWQPGPWILIDRVSGRVTALHLPEFDASLSEVAWYRDYAAYCGIHVAAKGGGLTAQVWQIGTRRAALNKVIAPWPQAERVRPVCAVPVWQREPMRVTMQPAGGDAVSYEVVGTSTQLVEDGEGGDDDN